MPSDTPRDLHAPRQIGAPGRGGPRDRPRAPEPRDRPERGPGRDVLARPPGAHPVGIGAGAAAGGAAGAILGAAAGPVGAVVGGALGAFAGGYIGREAAEAVNPTTEDRHWAEAYASRPYVIMGETYEYYRPAYHFGWESYRRTAELGDPASFDELEPLLAARWAATNASATLPWERARPAARDAWNRVARQGNDEPIETLHRLRDVCADSARGLRTAAEGLDDAAFIELVESWAQQRDVLAGELDLLAERLGADPDEVGPGPGATRRLWMNVRDVLPSGPHAILSECENNEGIVAGEYDEALGEDLPAAVEAALRRHVQVLHITAEQVRTLRDAAAG